MQVLQFLPNRSWSIQKLKSERTLGYIEREITFMRWRFGFLRLGAPPWDTASLEGRNCLPFHYRKLSEASGRGAHVRKNVRKSEQQRETRVADGKVVPQIVGLFRSSSPPPSILGLKCRILRILYTLKLRKMIKFLYKSCPPLTNRTVLLRNIYTQKIRHSLKNSSRPSNISARNIFLYLSFVSWMPAEVLNSLV